MQYTIKPELLIHIKPFKCPIKGDYVILMPDGKFLHWIESIDNSPTRVSKSNMAMQRWRFIEQAEGICEYLRELWDDSRFKTDARGCQIQIREMNVPYDRTIEVQLED